MSEDKDLPESELVDPDEETSAPVERKIATDAPEKASKKSRDEGPARVASIDFPEVKGGSSSAPEVGLDRVYDLTVPVTVELGKTQLTVQEILQLAPGAVVELDRAANAAVDLYVHGKVIAKGEIVVIDDFYGVRLTSVAGSDS